MGKQQIVIIGGGSSIKEGIEMGLWDHLKDKWTIGINFIYNYFTPTALCCTDVDFYNFGDVHWTKEQQKRHRKSLKDQELILMNNHPGIKEKLDNTVLINAVGGQYYQDISKGCYKTSLSGIFALSLAVYFLNEGDEIYMLGFDYGEKRNKDYERFSTSKVTLDRISEKKDGKYVTHFYDDIEHHGMGKINYYNQKGRAYMDFGPYMGLDKVKIYNVSLISKIPSDIFPKIGYNTLFNKLQDVEHPQVDFRGYMRKKLKGAGYE